MVKCVEVEIEGIRPMLQHRDVRNDEVDKLTKVVQKNPNDEKANTRLTEIAAYRTDDGKLYLPVEYLEMALVKAGTSERVQGQGKKSYKDIMNGQIFLEPNEIIITPQEYKMFIKTVRVMRSRIQRARPEFPKGWKATFKMNILDDSVPLDVIEKIIGYAGSYVGIGDWRPKYGLFKVNSFKEI